MSNQYSKEAFVDVLTSSIDKLNVVAQETWTEALDDKTLKAVLKHASKFSKVKNFAMLDVLPTESMAKELCESLNKNGFGIIPDPLLLILCEQYIIQVVKGTLNDTEFEFLTQSVWDILRDRYDTQKRAEEETNKILAQKGMCM